MRLYPSTRALTVVISLVLVLSLGCAGPHRAPVAAPVTPPATAQAPAGAPVSPTPPAPSVAAAQIPDSILWFRTAVEYRAGAVQAYRLATAQLERALADPSWSAALEQGAGAASKPTAVILDVDETVLDNSELEERNARAGVTYSEERWAAWCRELKAAAIPGALEFTRAARAKGVTVFYVTNREHTLEDATRQNLAVMGFPLDPSRDTVLTKGERPEWSSEKSSRRQLVAQDFRILLLVGDDFGDFVAGARTTLDARRALSEQHGTMWGTKWIVLPNPLYGSWKTAATAPPK